MKIELSIENIVLFLLSTTFLIGIWHGFPFTNVVADEMFFSGSVLRSIENYSILPLPLDVPYGTVTFYISYIFVSIGLVFMSIFFWFDIGQLKLFITENPFIIYGIARLVSFCIAILSLLTINNFLKRYIADYRTRLTLLVLLFTNILVNIIFHMSKVWVLSTFLFAVSFYFLVKIIDSAEERERKIYIWFCVLPAFLAFANFPLMGVSLIAIPIILYKYWNNQNVRKTLIQVTVFGCVLFLALVASNFSGIKSQVYSIIFDYTLSPGALAHNASIGFSTYLHLKKILVMFPLLLLVLIYALFQGNIRHRKLFFLSSFYLILYVVLLVFVDRWSVVDKAALRYSFPIPFFITFLVASFDFPWRKILLIPIAVSIIYLIPTLYFLSVPTTSHKAVDFVRSNYSSDSNAVFFNKVGADTPIPQNKLSYELFTKASCGSLCQATIKHDLNNDFKPITVLDAHTDPNELLKVMKGKTVYHVLRAASSSPDLLEIASFKGPVVDLDYYSADNSGSYFDFAYFKLERFGPNIYIYEKI